MRIETLVVFIVILGIVAAAEIGRFDRSAKSASDSNSSGTNFNPADKKRVLLRDYYGRHHHHHHGNGYGGYGYGKSGYGYSKSGYGYTKSGYGHSKSYKDSYDNSGSYYK